MSHIDEQNQQPTKPEDQEKLQQQAQGQGQQEPKPQEMKPEEHPQHAGEAVQPTAAGAPGQEGRPVERVKGHRPGLRGTAAMDPQTRKEVARKGGLAVSRNKQHMAEIGRKGGQSVSKNREHMAQIGRKGGAASRGHR